MLRYMSFKNFVNFKGFHSLEFKADKPTIFLGANSTGKSSVNELLRRCMSDGINASVSASFDDTSPAYVFSTFVIPKTTNEELTHVELVCSGVIKLPGNELISKIVWWKECDTEISHLSVFTYQSNGKSKTDSNDDIECENIISLMKEIAGNRTETSANKLAHVFESIGAPSYHPKKGRQLLEKLESMYIATLSFRSLGVSQWTRSEDFRLKEKHYHIAEKRAEILKKLMSYGDDKIDFKKADEIFTSITYPSKFEFKFNERTELTEVKGHTCMKPGSKFLLLKCPEGVLEAKQLSLLIALRNVYTLFLEEPDRGMHPQYVERVRNWLIKESKAKAFVIVTHSPYMVNTVSAENAFVFFRKPCFPEEKIMNDFLAIETVNRQITDVDELKKLIFATNVLFVEGKTDKIIIEAIYDWEIKHSLLQTTTFSRQIVDLMGKDNTKHLDEFCKKVSINVAYLFDRNKYIHLDKKTHQRIDKFSIPGTDKYNKYKGKDIGILTSDEAVMDQLFNDIENVGAFFWKDGDIEDAIRCSLKDEHFSDIFGHSPKDITNDTMKTKIKQMGRSKLDKLIGFLMEGSSSGGKNEFTRFLGFLHRMDTEGRQ